MAMKRSFCLFLICRFCILMCHLCDSNHAELRVQSSSILLMTMYFVDELQISFIK